MKKMFIFSLHIYILSFIACHKKTTHVTNPEFDNTPIVTSLTEVINEVSGITDSKANTGKFWAQEDSGNPPQLFLIQHDGKVVKKITLMGITNRDWEDLALIKDTIYLAETGDNHQLYNEYAIHLFAEPKQEMDTVKNIKTVKFRYPDGSHDAEALLVDPSTKDIFIITKRDVPSRIYKISAPYTNTVSTATFVDTLPFSSVVSAAISYDEKEIIIKTYSQLYHYTKNSTESIPQAIEKGSTTVPYEIEPQGEAVTFKLDHSGYLTLSEKGLFGGTPKIYFYKRN